MDARESEHKADRRAAGAPAPIELDALVPCGPGAAFDYFTRDIGRWWPLSRYSCSESRAAGVAFEACEGGKLIETDVDGRQYVWGTVSIWQPGRRIELSWHPGKSPDNALTLTIMFDAAGDTTRVRLVHSGWERLGDSAGEARASYANGWPTVLGQLYKGHCERAAAHANQVQNREAR